MQNRAIRTPLPVSYDSFQEIFRAQPDRLYWFTHCPHLRPIQDLHHHDAVEVGYCSSGAGIFLIDGAVCSFSAPCVTVLYPGQLHKARSLGEQRSQWMFITFREEAVLPPRPGRFFGLPVSPYCPDGKPQPGTGAGAIGKRGGSGAGRGPGGKRGVRPGAAGRPPHPPQTTDGGAGAFPLLRRAGGPAGGSSPVPGAAPSGDGISQRRLCSGVDGGRSGGPFLCQPHHPGANGSGERWVFPRFTIFTGCVSPPLALCCGEPAGRCWILLWRWAIVPLPASTAIF